MKNAWNKFRNNLDATREDDAGDIVQTLLIIAVFVVIVVIVGNMFYKALNDKGQQVTKCISGTTVANAGKVKGC